MSFNQSASLSDDEFEQRKNARDGVLSFGNTFLDEAMIGIFKHDLILVGARSGAGKTQFCVNIATKNIELGKRVHYIALEAEPYEIERRIKFQLFSKKAKELQREAKDLNKKILEKNDQKLSKIFEALESPISFQKWRLGDYIDPLEKVEASANSEFERRFTDLFTYYKQDSFNVDDFSSLVLQCAKETDLIIVDHVHYFDYDDDKENSAIKEISKTARSLALENGKPIILISHLRKADRGSNDMCPGLEDFHGSSDLFKIATKAITFSPGDWDKDQGQETFIRIVKNRFDGSVTRFMSCMYFNSESGSYEQKYKIGKANQKRDSKFETLDEYSRPRWCINAYNPVGNFGAAIKRPSVFS